MPLVHVETIAGRLDAAKKAALAEGLMKAVLAGEGIEDTPQARMLSWVFIEEVPKEKWFTFEGPDTRYLVKLTVPQGLLDDKGKQIAVTKVTEAVQAVEGKDVFLAAAGPWVIIEEVPDGNWGAAGMIVRRASIENAFKK